MESGTPPVLTSALRKTMERYLLIIDRVNECVLNLLGILLAIMSLAIVFQVISRFIFKFPIPWSEELARYLMVFCIFLGAGYAVRRGKLIGIEYVQQLLNTKGRVVVILFVHLSIVFFLIFVISISKDMLLTVKNQASPAMQISMIIPYGAIPAGAVLGVLNSLAFIFDRVILTDGKE